MKEESKKRSGDILVVRVNVSDGRSYNVLGVGAGFSIEIVLKS